MAGLTNYGVPQNNRGSWTGQGSGTPGFAEMGTWWDPAGIFAGPAPKAPLPVYNEPARPGYNPVFLSGSMSMAPEAERLTSNIMPNQMGMNKYREEALRSGPSAWSKLARTQMAGDEGIQRDQLRSQAASSAADARSQLARRGGLSGGAAERLAMNSDRNAMMGTQGLAAHALQGRNQIATTDEANRMKMLGALPGMELEQIKPLQWSAEQQLAARRGDISNQMIETKNMNDFNMAQWIQDQQRIQAMRNADVTVATAPKDKGFLGNIMGGLFG